MLMCFRRDATTLLAQDIHIALPSRANKELCKQASPGLRITLPTALFPTLCWGVARSKPSYNILLLLTQGSGFLFSIILGAECTTTRVPLPSSSGRTRCKNNARVKGSIPTGARACKEYISWYYGFLGRLVHLLI